MANKKYITFWVVQNFSNAFIKTISSLFQVQTRTFSSSLPMRPTNAAKNLYCTRRYLIG